MSIIELTYNDRIELLREKKLQQTQAKLQAVGYINEDDYGMVLPPNGFDWKPTATHRSGSWHGVRAWAENFRSLMEHHPVYVDPLDAMAGRCMFFLNRMRPEDHYWPEDFDYSHLKPEQVLYGLIHGIGSDAHFSPDLRIGLEHGWGGLLENIENARAAFGETIDGEKAEFYDAEAATVLGVQNFIRRTVEYIESLIETEEQPELFRNLIEMAQVNRHLIEQPPETFREACQWIVWFNIASRTYDRDGAGGQLDVLLWPYFEKDIEQGRLDHETAIFYLACLLINDPQYYQLGGPDSQGVDQTNTLSYLILEAAHRLQVSCNLTIRVHDTMDEQFFLQGVRHLLKDRKSWPRFSGDKALVEGFMKNGYSAELARQRIAVGCSWMAIPGQEYTLNDLVKINVAKVFEVAFREMIIETSNHSLDELWARFEEHLRRAVLCTARGIDFHLDHQYRNEPELMLNLLCHGPIERGVDVTNGGVDHYNMCVDGSGLATVADSFAAVEQRVVREKKIIWTELADQLENNYRLPDGERVRLMMKASGRYGQGGSLGDHWACRVSECLTRLVKASPTPGGRNLIPGWFSWADTVRLGKMVGATPDGRYAAEPISHGANPNPGFRDDAAATAMIRAIAEIQPGYGNTAPVQLELDPGIVSTDDAVEKVASLIRTHFDLGGTLFNVNIVDAEKIHAAHNNPSLYPDLVVRVTGFTAYFANLSPDFRQLVVDRILHN